MNSVPCNGGNVAAPPRSATSREVVPLLTTAVVGSVATARVPRTDTPETVAGRSEERVSVADLASGWASQCERGSPSIAKAPTTAGSSAKTESA